MPFMENVVSLHSLLRIESIIGDPLAQLVEHNTFNVGVLGSSPKRITRIERINLSELIFFIFHLVYQVFNTTIDMK